MLTERNELVDLNNNNLRKETFINPMMMMKSLKEDEFLDQEQEVEINLKQRRNYLSQQSISPVQNVGISMVWKKNFLNIIQIVSKFTQALKESSSAFKSRFLQKKFFKIINDKASNYRVYDQIVNGQKDDQSLIFRCRPTFFKDIGVLSPESLYKISFDILFMIVLSVNIFYLPVKLAFNLEGDLITFQGLPIAILIIEIILNFNTAFYQQGQLNGNRKLIAIRYLKQSFLTDLIVLGPFILQRYIIYEYLAITLFLKISSILKIINNLEELLNLRERYAVSLDLIRLTCFMVAVTHFSACGFFYVGRISDQNSWINERHIENLPILNQYIESLYWSTMTILTVGYGDIVPISITEKVYVMIMAIFGTGVFGYSIASIGQIFREREERVLKQKNLMTQIKSYLKRKQISLKVNTEVKRYFEYFFSIQSQSDDVYLRKVFDSSLNQDILKHLLVDQFNKTLKKSQFINHHFSEPAINDLCLQMKQCSFLPDETIFRTNEQASKLYFIESGKVEISVECSNQTSSLREFQKDYIMGEIYFMSQLPMPYTAKTKEYTIISYLEYDDFINCLKKYPNDYEIFCFKRDQIKFSKIKVMGNVCDICSSNHQFKKCPFIFFNTNINKIQYEDQLYRQQQRQYQLRRGNSNVRLSKQTLVESTLAYAFLNDLVQYNFINEGYLKNIGLPVRRIQQLFQQDNNLSEIYNSNSQTNQLDRVQKQKNRLQQDIQLQQNIQLQTRPRQSLNRRTSWAVIWQIFNFKILSMISEAFITKQNSQERKNLDQGELLKDSIFEKQEGKSPKISNIVDKSVDIESSKELKKIIKKECPVISNSSSSESPSGSESDLAYNQIGENTSKVQFKQQDQSGLISPGKNTSQIINRQKSVGQGSILLSQSQIKEDGMNELDKLANFNFYYQQGNFSQVCQEIDNRRGCTTKQHNFCANIQSMFNRKID